MSEEALRVLLVDDEASLRKPLARYLSDTYGYQVDTAADGEETWERVLQAERPYDVALIDDLLPPEPGAEPEPSGIDLMRRIKERCPETEVIIFTGWSMLPGWGTDRALSALRGGAYRYLTKPFDYEELGMTIRMAAEHRQLKQQLETAKQEREWLQTFLEVGKATTLILDFDQVLEEVRRQIARLMDVSGLHVVLYDEENQMLRFELCFDRGKKQAKWQRPFASEEGLTDWVIGNLQPLLLRDYPNDPLPVPAHERHYGDELDQEVSRSWLGVPLNVRDKVIGAITVQSYEPHRFDETDQQILFTVASQIAIAIENARLFEEVEQRVMELETLQRTSLQLTSSLNLSTVLDNIAEGALTLVGAADCHIYLYDETSETLTFGAALCDDGRREPAVKAPRRDGFTVTVVRENQPVVINDARNHPLYATPEAQKWNVQSIAGFPLKRAGRVLGVFTITFLKPHTFSEEELRVLGLMADQAAIAINNARLYQEAKRRQQLLTALDEASRHIRAEKGTFKLLHEVVRLAAWLVGCEAGCLFINRPHLEELELSVTYGLSAEIEIAKSRLPHTEGLAGLVARTGDPQIIYGYSDWPDCEAMFAPHSFRAAAGVPLRKQAGEVEAVLLVFDGTSPEQLSQADLEILDRFAAQAAIALHTSQLMGQEQRMFSQLSILHQISDCIQAARDLDKILQVVLTGVTAGYGLGFNRAALLLLDEQREYLVGRMGIGYLEELEAREDWDQHHKRRLENFQKYLELLEQDKLPPTPVGERVREMRLQIAPEAHSDLLSQAMHKRQCTLVTQDELDGLPESFVKSFEPALPLVFVPLMARYRAIGLLVVDNKVTKSPVTPEDEEILLTFANTAAIAIENAQLFLKVKEARDTAKVVAQVTVLGDLEATLLSVAQGTEEVVGCDAVTLFVYNQITNKLDHPPTMVGVREPDKASRYGEVLTESLVYEMLQRDEPYIVEKVAQDDLFRDRRFSREEGIESCVAVPLMAVGQKVGVMFVNYRSRHRFTGEELTNINLFADQAAVAIRNAQLYDETTRRANTLQTLYEAGNIVTSSLALDETLNRIAEQAWHLTGQYGKYARFSDLELVEGNRLRVKAAYPPKHLAEMQKLVGDIDLEHDERIGITGRAVRTGQCQLVDDITRESDYIECDPETRSELAVPIKFGEEVIGVINVEHPDTFAFDQQDQQALEALAAQAALAIQNAQLYQQLQQRIRTLQALYQAGRAITSTLTLQETLDQIVEQAMLLIESRQEEGCLSHLALVEGNVLHFVAACTLEILKGLKEKVGDIDLHSTRIGITGRVAKTGRSQNVGDVNADPDYICFEPRTLSELAVPIKIGEQVIGVINVEHPERDAFSADDQRALESLAAQAAIAIRNARQSELSRAIYDASKVISTGVVVARRELLDRILEQAATRIRWPQRPKALLAHIKLYDEGDNELHFESVYPPEEFSQLVERITEKRSLEREKAPGGRIGVSGRAVLEREAQRVLDVRTDVDYVEFHPETLSELDVPLKLGDKILGVLGLESDRLAAFDEMDKRALQSLAELAVIAIQNAELYQKEADRVRELSGLHSISQTIRSLTDIQEVYQQVNESMALLIGVEMCAVLLYNEAEEALVCQLPMYGVPDKIGQRYRIPLGEGTAAAIWEEEDHLILNDVGRHPLVTELGLKKLAKEAGLRDTLLAKLTVGNRNIGVVQVSNKLDETAFNENDARLLHIFTNQAAAVVENARLYEELKQAKGFVGTMTAVAWMGTVAGAWRHAIGNYATTIEDLVKHIRSDLKKNARASKINGRLTEIEEVISEIREVPMPPLSTEEGVESVFINELVERRIEQLRTKRGRYDRVIFETDFALDSAATVRASPEWLRRVLDILVNNAVNAMADTPIRQLTIVTRSVDDSVEIVVKDTGKGIPKGVRSKLFQKPIEKPKGVKGSGLGLFLAQAIIQTYGGKLDVDSTGPTGTTMIFWLPLEV
jgi:GAF domain-containing protein/response regulator of citrate/malate metabolism